MIWNPERLTYDICIPPLTKNFCELITQGTVLCADFQRLTPVNREKAIQKLRKEHLSLRQISRLTGVSLMIIRRIVEK